MKLLEFDPGLIFWTFITFGFLLIVLKMVAWKPILTMLEEREKSVREALEGAEKARQEVADLSRKNQEMLDGVRRQADEILGRGRIEVDRVRTEILEKTKKEAENILADGRKQMEREYRAALKEIRAGVADLAIGAARSILVTGINEDKQRQLVEEYLNSLPETEGRLIAS